MREGGREEKRTVCRERERLQREREGKRTVWRRERETAERGDERGGKRIVCRRERETAERGGGRERLQREEEVERGEETD